MASTTTNPRPSERKIRAPSDFNGDRAEASGFLNNCQTYLRLNKDSYTNDEEKIIFILSYMVGGSAGPFKEAFTTNAFAIDPDTNEEKGFGTWAQFLTRFQDAFTPLNPVDNAITQMKALKQSGTADDYVAAFRPLAIRSTITEVAVLSDYFLTGLTTGLVKSIMSVETLPTTMDGYYKLATRLDLQWRKGLELTRGAALKKTSPNAPVTTSKSTSAVRLRKLTDEERTKLRKEGRCFRCREAGHISAECPQGGQNPQTRRQIRVATSTTASTTQAEPESAIARMRALYAQFTPEEREVVVNIAEAEGF